MGTAMMSGLSYRLEQGCSTLGCRRKGKFGWMQHIVILLSFVLFVVGCCMIGYMAWVLSTSVTISRFLSGELMFTYVMVIVGFLYFFSGLLGWVAAFAENYCLLRMFLAFLFVLILGQIGGVLAVYVIQLKMADILRSSWSEVNQNTRNFVQSSLACCGFNGPKEFAYTNYPVDDSCYDDDTSSGVYISDSTTLSQQLIQTGCGPLMLAWMEDNKASWVPGIASLVGVQLLTLCVTIYVVKRKRKTSKSSRSSSTRRLHSLYE